MRVRLRRWGWVVALCALWATVTYAQSGRGPDFASSADLRKYLVSRAEQTVFPERCAECHKSEFAVWEDTLHATQFSTLHTKNSAKEIYQALNLTLIRRATDEQTPACLQCHYTPRVDGTSIRASIGVSCESCHGPAREWIGVHNDYGVRSSDPQQAAKAETPEHRQQRIADSRAKGQLRSSDIYGVVANCFGCHTVPHETLVNVGGHSAGGEFELVGELAKIRHNFLQSFLTGDGTANADRPAAYKRVLYVVGRALDVEYSLRGVAVATSDDSYLQAMVSRHDAAVDALIEIGDTVAIPEIARIREAIRPAALKAGNRAALVAIADAVGTATQAFIARSNGSELGALDPLWDPTRARPAAPAARASDPEPPPVPTITPSPGTTTPSPGTAPPPVVPPPVAGRSGGVAPGTSNVVAPRPVAGQPARRPSWRPPSTNMAVGCDKCHVRQRRWYATDAHKTSLRNFTAPGPERDRRLEIAAAYGLSAAEMVRPDQMCMSCHAELTTTAKVSVRNGVDCQQCHGAAEKYLASHEEESYAQSIAPQRGLVDLKNPETRARTCMGCHYVTDARLLTAGHSSGSDFRLSERVAEIKHWPDSSDIAAGRLESAQNVVVAERGPVPAVTVTAPGARSGAAGGSTAVPPVTPPPPGPTSTVGSGSAVGTPSPAAGGRGAAVTGTSARPPVPAATPAPGGVETRVPVPAPAAAPGSAPVDPIGPRSPVVNAEPSVDELLLQIKRRLEELYARLRGSGGG